MAPTHGYFHRAQSMAPRQIQPLRVESNSLNGLLPEDHAAALALEGFETALRIDKWQPQDAAHNFVENDSREFAEGRLVHSDQSAVHGPRANRYVAVLQRVDQFSGFLNRRGEVGVCEKCDAAARFMHAVAHAVALAAVETIRDQPERRNLDAKILCHCGGAIL